MKVYGGVDIEIQGFLASALVGGVVSFKTPPLFFRKKNPRYPLDRRLGGSQSRYGKVKNCNSANDLYFLNIQFAIHLKSVSQQH
jgi:hypothetical protein